ncbi:MAG: hypothetical protein AABY49_10265 [Planctomycetota bacterium]
MRRNIDRLLIQSCPPARPATRLKRRSRAGAVRQPDKAGSGGDGYLFGQAKLSLALLIEPKRLGSRPGADLEAVHRGRPQATGCPPERHVGVLASLNKQRAV